MAAFILEDDVGKWRDSSWTNEKKLIAIWTKFDVVFDCHFISEDVKAMRRVKFFSLSQGEMLVVDFEWKFNALATFFLGCSSLIRIKLGCLRHIFREVVDAAMVIEIGWLATHMSQDRFAQSSS